MRNSLLFLFLHTASVLWGQETPHWLRYPAIAPDAGTILFTFKGDIYKVASKGGDGSLIAIDKNGNITMPFFTPRSSASHNSA